MRLEGKTILVTGSTDGVGRVVAKRLAAEGANVLVHGRSQQRAEAVLKEICGARVRPKKGMATFYQADFSSLAEVRGLAEADRKQRRAHGLCLVEGTRLVSEALSSGLKVGPLLFSLPRLSSSASGRALLERIERLPQAE